MKKIFCFSLTSFLFIFSYISPVSAAAGDIIIGGDPLGTGGLFDGSFVGQAGIASIFAFLGLKAAQIDVHLTEEYIESGGTHVSFVQQKLNEWADGSPWFQTLIQGVRIAEDGIIYYQQAALDIIKQFGNWVTGSDSDIFYEGDPTVSTPELQDAVLGGSLSVALVTNGTEIPVSNNSNNFKSVRIEILSSTSPVYMFLAYPRGGVMSPHLISANTFSANLYWINQADGIGYTVSFKSVGHFNNWYANGFEMVTNSYGAPEVPVLEPLPNNIGQYLNTLSSEVTLGDVPVSVGDTFYGDKEEWSDFVGGLSLPDGYMGAIDPGLLGQIQGELDQTKDYVLDLKDYIKALEDSLNEQAVADVPIQDTQNGVIELIPDIPFETQPEYEQVAPEDLPSDDQTLPIVDPAILADPADIISSNTLDLTDLFPFCIPFDIYEILQKFKTAPVTPQYRVQFHIPLVDVDVDYLIDFSMFDTTAQILRVMELIALVVALAVATRAIYLRS